MLAIVATACGDAPTPVAPAPASTSVATPVRATQAREDAYRAELAEVDRQAASIDRELASLADHPWAGRYYSGDRLGTNIDLRVSPNGGVAVTNWSDMGLWGANAGDVEERAGRLHLRFRFPQVKSATFPDELFPLRWGRRRYLIAPGEMAAFVESVNEGFEPRATSAPSLFLLAVGDERLPIDGPPNLPSPWREALRMHPIDARVSKVVQAPDGHCRMWFLTIDKGSAEGMAMHASLARQPATVGVGSLQLTYVGEHESVGRLSDDGCRNGVYVEPRVGWVFRAPPFDEEVANARIRSADR